jgi:hypothetical protein
VLASERAVLMPKLDDALLRFAAEQTQVDISRQRRFAV